MCLTIPKKIISIQSNKAIVEFENVKQEVDCSLVDNVKPNDYIISQSGYAIRKIDSQNAREILELMKK